MLADMCRFQQARQFDIKVGLWRWETDFFQQIINIYLALTRYTVQQGNSNFHSFIRLLSEGWAKTLNSHPSFAKKRHILKSFLPEA